MRLPPPDEHEQPAGTCRTLLLFAQSASGGARFRVRPEGHCGEVVRIVLLGVKCGTSGGRRLAVPQAKQ